MEPIRVKAHDLVFEDYFSNTIKHKTDLIQEQLELGLYSIKRYAFYLQKMVAIKRPALEEMRKVTDYETKEKSSRASKDAMTQHVQTYHITQSVMGNLVDAELEFINKIDKEAVTQILQWHKTAEKRLEVTIKKLNALFAKQKDMLVRVTKSRQECHKAWTTLQSLFKDLEKAETQKLSKKNGIRDFETAEKKYRKEAPKVNQLFHLFEAEIRDANDQQYRYWNEELPQIVKDFEQLELERLQVWGIALETYANSQSHYFHTTLGYISILDQQTEGLNPSAELKDFADNIVRHFNLPKEPDFIMDHLPCSFQSVSITDDDLPRLLSLDLSVAIAHRQQQLQLHGANNSGSGLNRNSSFGYNSHRPVVSSSQPVTGGATVTTIAQPQGSPQPTTTTAAASGASSSSTTATGGGGVSTTTSGAAGGSPQVFMRPAAAIKIAQACYDFQSNDEEDLSLSQGEYIAILEMPPPEDDDENGTWWLGARFDLSTGEILQRGIFPSTYVILIEPE